MPSVLEAIAKEPASQSRLVVYITPEQASWLDEIQKEARARGRRLSASAVIRAAIDQLREQAS